MGAAGAYPGFMMNPRHPSALADLLTQVERFRRLHPTTPTPLTVEKVQADLLVELAELIVADAHDDILEATDVVGVALCLLATLVEGRCFWGADERGTPRKLDVTPAVALRAAGFRLKTRLDLVEMQGMSWKDAKKEDLPTIQVLLLAARAEQ